MNAIRFGWRAAMADATAEQHADLAVLVADAVLSGEAPRFLDAMEK